MLELSSVVLWFLAQSFMFWSLVSVSDISGCPPEIYELRLDCVDCIVKVLRENLIPSRCLGVGPFSVIMSSRHGLYD